MIESSTSELLTMKLCASSLILLLSAASFAYGQAAGKPLSITGTVLEVQPAVRAPNPAAKTSQAEKDPDAEFPIRIQLQLQFKNQTERPLILFRPSEFPGKKQVVFLSNWPMDEGTEVEAVQYNPPDKRPRWKIADANWWVARKLQADEPDPTYFVVIKPGGYFECVEYFEIKNGFEIDRGMKHGEILRSRPKPEFPALKIKYQFSRAGTAEEPDPLEAASRKWRPVGDLLLTPDGKYSVVSEPILNVKP